MSELMTESCVVSDSTCLIGLERIDRLDILPQLYNSFYIPSAVKKEIGFVKPWMKVRKVRNLSLVSSLRSSIDWVESEAITLTLELDNAVIVLDDKRARQIAARFDLTITGTMGVLLKAKRQDVIASVRPILDSLESVEFRIAPFLRHRTLELANEL
ncbi:MAG: DUF3368 domain-containing protein [Phormidesmis sp.]